MPMTQEQQRRMAQEIPNMLGRIALYEWQNLSPQGIQEIVIPTQLPLINAIKALTRQEKKDLIIEVFNSLPPNSGGSILRESCRLANSRLETIWGQVEVKLEPDETQKLSFILPIYKIELVALSLGHTKIDVNRSRNAAAKFLDIICPGEGLGDILNKRETPGATSAGQLLHMVDFSQKKVSENMRLLEALEVTLSSRRTWSPKVAELMPQFFTRGFGLKPSTYMETQMRGWTI